MCNIFKAHEIILLWNVVFKAIFISWLNWDVIRFNLKKKHSLTTSTPPYESFHSIKTKYSSISAFFSEICLKYLNHIVL